MHANICEDITVVADIQIFLQRVNKLMYFTPYLLLHGAESFLRS